MRRILTLLLSLALLMQAGLPSCTADEKGAAGVLPLGVEAPAVWPAPPGDDRQTIVPVESRISDHEARLALARIFAGEETSREEARRLYLELLEGRPDDPDVLTGLSDLALATGHVEEGFKLYRRVVAIDGTETRRLGFADRMLAAGDFYGTEKLFREHLAKHPGERAVLLKLVEVLMAMQRTEEAEGMCRRVLLDEPSNADVLLVMARLKTMEKLYGEAESWAEKALAAAPQRGDALLLLGDILSAQRRYMEARKAFIEAGAGDFRVRAAIGIGRSYLKEGAMEPAQKAFADALALAPEEVEVRFRASWPERAVQERFITDIIREERSPRRLSRWAELYASEGQRGQAIRMYDEVLARDPAYFPALISLAELLALEEQFERSISLYEDLAGRFPGASKILIGQARVLGWSKRYRASLDLYGKIHLLNPGDPVPVREMARTALWGKQYQEAMAAYGVLLANPVDRSLLAALLPAAKNVLHEPLQDAVRTLQGQTEQGSLTEGYDSFRLKFAQFKGALPRKTIREIETALVDHLSAWRIQKAVALEMQAKNHSWGKRTTRALPLYEELIQVEPANEEARFDLAQAFCALDQRHSGEKVYRELLEIDPFHARAARALKLQEIRYGPVASLQGYAWQERGRGELAQIQRFQTTLGLDVPLSKSYRLKFKALDWIERPRHDDRSYHALGPGLEINAALSPDVRGEAGWAYKDYRDKELAPRHTGYGRLWFYVMDAAVLGLGAERSDAIANLFGLRQGIQSDTLWISARSDLTRNLEIGGTARWLEYSDGNGGRHHSVTLGYAFTDHPRILKVILSGDYRDMRQKNVYVYQGDALVDILHPYWTPERNKTGEVTLEWRHDLAKEFFCGNEAHYYDIKLSLGTDSESNRSVRFEAEWQYEFRERWALTIRGMVHRSRDWDAESLLGEISYRF